MKYLFSTFCFLLCVGFIQAQNHSNISVEVQKKNDERQVKITKETNGESKVFEWTDKGEIPAEVAAQLKKEGIDVKILEGDNERKVVVKKEVEVKSDGKKKVIIIKNGNEGDVQELEWDGKGEMPEEIEELMKGYDIDVDEDGGTQVKMIKIRKARDESKASTIKEMKRGKSHNKKEGQSYMIFNEDGDEDVMEWSEDGEHEIIMKKGGDKRLHEAHGNVLFIADEENDFPMSKAYVGAQIGNKDKGVEILDLIKDGPADMAKLQKGDIVLKVNGARTKNVDGFMRLLNYFEPKDEVDLSIIRDGKERNVKLSLGERPNHAK